MSMDSIEGMSASKMIFYKKKCKIKYVETLCAEAIKAGPNICRLFTRPMKKTHITEQQINRDSLFVHVCVSFLFFDRDVVKLSFLHLVHCRRR